MKAKGISRTLLALFLAFNLICTCGGFTAFAIETSPVEVKDTTVKVDDDIKVEDPAPVIGVSVEASAGKEAEAE